LSTYTAVATQYARDVVAGNSSCAWRTGVSLVVPLEVRSEAELALVAKLARRLMLGQTTLEAEFPGYRFGKTDWLHEQGLR
jgi:hypothetical protein